MTVLMMMMMMSERDHNIFAALLTRNVFSRNASSTTKR